MFVVRWTLASSSSATLAIAYGGGNAADHWWRFTVKPTTVARPDTTVCTRARLLHAGQIGTGGWTSLPQSPHPWMRSVPSSPDVQNHWLASVSCGSGRTSSPGSDAAQEADDLLRRRVRAGHAGTEVTGVGDDRDAGDPGGRIAAQEREWVGLLERGRRFDAGLLAVVRAEPEPHLLVGLGQRRVGRSGHDRVDADAPLQERERFA